MNKTIELARGDACPNDGGTLVRVQVPTAEQRRLAADRENPTPIPAHYDTASDTQRQQLGELFRCERCNYLTRFPFPEAAAAGAAK